MCFTFHLHFSTEEIDFFEQNTADNLLLRYKNRFQLRETKSDVKRRNYRYSCNPCHDFWHRLRFLISLKFEMFLTDIMDVTEDLNFTGKISWKYLKNPYKFPYTQLYPRFSKLSLQNRIFLSTYPHKISKLNFKVYCRSSLNQEW